MKLIDDRRNLASNRMHIKLRIAFPLARMLFAYIQVRNELAGKRLIPLHNKTIILATYWCKAFILLVQYKVGFVATSNFRLQTRLLCSRHSLRLNAYIL